MRRIWSTAVVTIRINDSVMVSPVTPGHVVKAIGYALFVVVIFCASFEYLVIA